MFNMKIVDLDESWLNRQITSNTTFRWKKLYSHTFKPYPEELIVIHPEKMKVKYMNEDVWKSFLCKLAG